MIKPEKEGYHLLKCDENERCTLLTHPMSTYLGPPGCEYWLYASSGEAAVLACSESAIWIVGIIVCG